MNHSGPYDLARAREVKLAAHAEQDREEQAVREAAERITTDDVVDPSDALRCADWILKQ